MTKKSSKASIKKDKPSEKKESSTTKGRGRPSKKNKEKEAESNDALDKNTKKEKPKKEPKEPKLPKTTKAKTEEPSEPSELDKIYGTESAKSVSPFPISELQTQTKNIIIEYDIDVTRLPQNIVDAVNGLIQPFTEFVQNPNMFNLVGTIMDKDLVALNLIKEWLQPVGGLLLDLKSKKQETEGKPQEETIKVLEPVVAPNTNTAPSVVITDNNVTKEPKTPIHQQNPLTPREPKSTYEHTINAQSPVATTPSLGTNENKNIHYEMLSKANAGIQANNHAQQNLQFNPPPIDKEKQFKDYAVSIMNTIKGTFQMNHWGYIPIDVLTDVLNGCSKAYKYEIVSNKEESYINISDGKNTIATENFSIQ